MTDSLRLEQCWRWFGPNDPVTLAQIKQSGATGIVTALHDIPNGELWPEDAIAARRAEIEAAGLRWSVVESVPVHESIKLGRPEAPALIKTYAETLRRLGRHGIDTVCYNLMPAVDWTRTRLAAESADGAEALRFDMVELALFDIHILQRDGAREGYDAAVVEAADARSAELDEDARRELEKSIIKGLPGSEESWTTEQFRAVLNAYREMTPERYRANVVAFLNGVLPAAEEAGLRLAVHPDDPPFSLFGLPRVVSTAEDLEGLFAELPSPANGVTLCVGSFGSRADNDLPSMVRRFADRIQFVHLRNVRRDPDGSFSETHHLEGDLDMPAIVSALIDEQERRRADGRPDVRMPWRPDHGLRMLDDLARDGNPGYSLIGRLKGLAEMRGLEIGLRHAKGLPS